jgi:hypothetical protein
MRHLSAETKHAILLEYRSHSPTHGFEALARRHSVKGGKQTIRRWHSRWNGTPQSLERHEGSGTTPILTPSDVSRYVRAPILAANQSHRAVSYTQLLPSVRQKTRKSISLRTLQRTGKEQLQIHSKATRKRTRDECEYTQTHVIVHACVCRVPDADLFLQCLLLSVTRSQRCDANYNIAKRDTSSFSMRLHYVYQRLQRAHSYFRDNSLTSS